MRPYDRYIKEREYYNAFGVCKHAEECKILRPKDFESCPGFKGYLCTPMRVYYLQGCIPSKPRPKPMPTPQRQDTSTLSYGFAILSCMWVVLGLITYGFIIAKYGLVGFVFGAEPFACVVAMGVCIYQMMRFSASSNQRGTWWAYFISAIELLLIGVFVAYYQIRDFVYHDADLWLWFVSASIMLMPLGFLTQCYLNYKANEQRKTRRIK